MASWHACAWSVDLCTLIAVACAAGVYVLQPLRTSLRELLACEDPSFLDFLEQLLQFDPDRRPFAAAALQHPWLQTHLGFESKDDEERSRPKSLFTTKIGGYTSSPLPSTPGSSQPSRPGSSQPSRPNSPDLDASRGPSPTKQPRDSSPLSREVCTSHGNSVRSSVGRQARRQSIHQHDGPGVPEEFRNSLQCEETRSSGASITASPHALPPAFDHSSPCVLYLFPIDPHLHAILMFLRSPTPPAVLRQ